MPEPMLLLGDDLRAVLAIARSLGRRGAEVHAAPADFSSSSLKPRCIAAAPAPDGDAPAARRQAA